MLMETVALTKRYADNGGVTAVDRAHICLEPGETLGLFGQSGSGKTTLGMMVAGLLRPTSGEIRFHGKPVSMNYTGEVRRKIQILFQHPETSFNPELILLRSMTEPYRKYRLPYTYQGMLEYLKRFGIYEEHLLRRPAELSGGELQRASLARILLLEPEIIVLDEPTSMLDVITQVQVIHILKDYQKESNAAFLMVSHNRALCDQVCDRIYTVERGVFTPLEDD